MGVMSERVAAISDTSIEYVTVPEWEGLRLEVRSLSLAERNRIAMATRTKKGDTDVNEYYAALVIATTYDPESGEKAFSASDRVMLQGKNGAATDRIAKVAMRLSGLGLDDDASSDGDDEDERSSLDRAIDDAGKGSSSTGS